MLGRGFDPYKGVYWQKGSRLGGGSFEPFKGVYWQKGSGLGNTFKKFWSWIVPVLKKHALPKLQSGIEAIGSEGVSTVKNIYKDVVKGKNFKNSAEDNIDSAVTNLQNKAEAKLEGQGIPTINKKRKKKIVRFNRKSKKVFQDIFN